LFFVYFFFVYFCNKLVWFLKNGGGFWGGGGVGVSSGLFMQDATRRVTSTFARTGLPNFSVLRHGKLWC